MNFIKYQALGNDYIVIDGDYSEKTIKNNTKNICNRHYGIGSDGILFGYYDNNHHMYRLKIFNPDGSEAEKSGNGLRIFARYLKDKKLIKDKTFSILTLGGLVKCEIKENNLISINMGTVSFNAENIPVNVFSSDVINQLIKIDDKSLRFSAITVGNPHCVILLNEVTEDLARDMGPKIENHFYFPNRINVQFMKVINKNNIKIEIWERGAGYTYASGSSSTAAACVAHKLGLCDSNIDVHMPGGIINISIDKRFNAKMTGPVEEVFQGSISKKILI